MSTLAMTYRNVTYEPRRLSLKPLLLVVLFAAVLLCAHAIVRHGAEAEAVRRCMDESGPVAHLFNPATGRHYFICQLEDEEGKPVYGIQIRIKDGWQWKEISSFLKNKMHRLEDVIRYIEKCGAGVCQ